MASKKKAKGGAGLDQDQLHLIGRVVGDNGRKYLPRYLIAFVLMAIVAGMTAASAWIMKSVINDVFIARNEALVGVVAVGVFAIFSIRGLADYGQTVVMNGIGRNIIADQQKRLYNHLLAQGMDYFNAASLGEIVTRVSHSSMAIRQVLDLIIRSLGKDLLSVIALVGVMIAQDPLLSVLALVIMPAILFGMRMLVRRIRNIGRAEYAGMAKIIASVKDTVLGIRVVKSFGMEDRLKQDMYRTIDDTAKRSLKMANLSARSVPLMEFFIGLSMGTIIMYAGHGIVAGERDAGSLFAFIAAVLLAYEPAKRLARLRLQLETGLIGVGIVYDFLDTPISTKDADDAQPLKIAKGKVELRDLSFAYGKKSALKDLSVIFPAGKVSALVGPSGAGKSTIFSLIERFYDPQKGAVLVDGQDVRTVTMQSLRASIAYVTQEAFLFEGTVRDNILAGRPGASEDELVAAATAANAHEFILEIPGGYNAQVGEGGGNLSGGQRQRIAIARAMLRNAPILLLDEATSALDAVSEAKVKQALDTLMSGRTTIVIAHRLSTVRNADVIHVIDGGRLVESGTHEALVAQGGSYAHLSALQFSETAPRQPRKPDLAEAVE